MQCIEGSCCAHPVHSQRCCHPNAGATAGKNRTADRHAAPGLMSFTTSVLYDMLVELARHQLCARPGDAVRAMDKGKRAALLKSVLLGRRGTIDAMPVPDALWGQIRLALDKVVQEQEQQRQEQEQLAALIVLSGLVQ